MEFDITDVETVLKETKVKMAEVPNLRDFYPNIQPIQSPLLARMKGSYYSREFSKPGAFVMQEKFYREMSELHSSLKFQRATAQSEILCNPAKVKAAIATIGEICPGKNVCIRSLVKCLEQDSMSLFVAKQYF